MWVVNETDMPITACCRDALFGIGEEVSIPAYGSREVEGPDVISTRNGEEFNASFVPGTLIYGDPDVSEQAILQGGDRRVFMEFDHT